ncbi:MAG: AlpA family transcriptional regulator, partial [Pseudomonadales bacterium]
NDGPVFLRLKEVVVKVGLSRSTIYKILDEGNFPASFRLGDKAVGWLQSDIERWMMERKHQ